MFKSYWWYCVLMILITTSCLSEKQARKRYPCPEPVITSQISHTTDSTVPRPVMAPADSSLISLYAACVDENGKLTGDKIMLINQMNSQTGRIISVPGVSIDNNVITAKCKTDTGAIVKWFMEHNRTTTTETVKTLVVYREKPLSWWMQTRLNVGTWVIILVLIYVALRIIKSSIPGTSIISKLLKFII